MIVGVLELQGFEKRIGTSPIEHNGFIFEHIISFTFKWSDQRESSALLGGCALRSAKHNFTVMELSI